ncbi:unnamed protein product [Arabis nemorensis]|uniref:ATPase AAA-type core domain-containing protein n=1 Tax=Arabis nemorensis TaxID=586526 RepID=A0A565BLQ7_9BRAS|nr:unnamed protein product [Arabis nemorensis]
MVRRRSSVPVRGFTNLVQESWKKGLNLEEIVNELRSKNRECVRKSPKNLMVKVKQIVKSLSNEEEESNGIRKKQRLNDPEQRNSDFDISSGIDELDSFSGNDDLQFDITNDGLRASYSNKSRTRLLRVEEKTKKTERGKSCDVEVKGPTFKDFGGLKDVVDEMNRYVKRPLLFPDIVQGLGLKPLSGLLLHGPPGGGKSTLAYAIANEAGVPFYMLSASELVSGVFGTIDVTSLTRIRSTLTRLAAQQSNKNMRNQP